ncbi:hypothetical protein PISL3812_00265 [Talaromyces islandicus]|uniref:Uncharacterized protein n=1 Tax=Talaromyces islandicus TaxID=28573 RepID=A0A0U1LIV0_TALIS|nr:hypothetical protein PISL3812_00265 [Talaromyces islandicus]
MEEAELSDYRTNFKPFEKTSLKFNQNRTPLPFPFFATDPYHGPISFEDAFEEGIAPNDVPGFFSTQLPLSLASVAPANYTTQISDAGSQQSIAQIAEETPFLQE